MHVGEFAQASMQAVWDISWGNALPGPLRSSPVTSVFSTIGFKMKEDVTSVPASSMYVAPALDSAHKAATMAQMVNICIDTKIIGCQDTTRNMQTQKLAPERDDPECFRVY